MITVHKKELETREVETTCHRCYTPFTCQVTLDANGPIYGFYDRTYCPTCRPAVKQEAQEREAKCRLEYWDKVCPKLYQQSDRECLPPQIVQPSDSWRFGPQGLGFIGQSGKGKTRSMFLLLRRMIIDEGRKVQYVTTTKFSMEVAAKGFEVGPYIESLCTVELLFLDDLGKGRLSDAVQAHLFHIVETRTANELPILFTSNAASKELAAMLSEDRAAPLLRRLNEFCEIIKL